MKHRIVFSAVLFCFLLVIVFYSHNVSREINSEDQKYIEKLFNGSYVDFEALKNNGVFDNQILSIQKIQNVVIDYSLYQKPIPAYQTREPKDFFEAASVNCFDRGRFFDKAFRLLGYDTRYVAVFSKPKTQSKFKTLLTKDRNLVRSHVLVEVKTAKGWMAIDTVQKWIALSQSGVVYDAKNLENILPFDTVSWSDKNKDPPYWLLQDNFITVYGLYSRHGKYYPPYNFIPDVNWPELLQNF